VIWAAFLVAFVAIGSLGLREIADRIRISRAGPQSSTDTVFLRTLGVENASARIAACLQGLPADEPIAIVYQNAPLAGLDALLIGSIAWPHPIPQISLNPGEALDNARLQEVNATRAIFFLGMPRPNASEHVRSLSPLMHFYRSPTVAPSQ
jgi:hypothetical protein